MTNQFDILIVGAGPGGIEAALQANLRGFKVLLIDREEAGSLIWNTMRQKKFYHSYGRNTTPPQGKLFFPDRKKGEELVLAWRKQAEKLGYLPHTALLKLSKNDNGYSCLLSNNSTIKAKYVIVASGTHENPRILGIGGEADNPNLSYSLDYGDIPFDQKIVVVGGGNTAVETALECALDNDVALIVRKPQLRDSVTEKNKTELDQEIEAGTVKMFWESNITLIGQDQVHGKRPDGTFTLPCNHLYIHIGFESPIDWFADLGLELNDRELPKISEQYQSNLPGVYVIGSLTGADSVVESANQAIQVINDLTKTRQSA